LDPSKRQLAFHACQWRAEAEVGSPPEGDVAVVSPADVEPVRVGKTGRVTISRAHHRNDRLAPADGFAAELQIIWGHAGGVLAGALVAQKLFHGGRHQRWVGPQPLHLVRVPQESQQAVSDQVGRLLTPDHGHDRVRDHLFLAQPVAIHLRRRQGMNQAIPRLVAVSAHRGAKVGGHLIQAPQHLRHPVRVVLEVAQHLGEVLRPGFQLVAVGRRHSQQFRGHDCRQRVGQVGDHIHRVAGPYGVQQALHDLLNVSKKELHPAGGERPRGQAANPAVGWRSRKSI